MFQRCATVERSCLFWGSWENGKFQHALSPWISETPQAEDSHHSNSSREIYLIKYYQQHSVVEARTFTPIFT
jgi:hypothetical protein